MNISATENFAIVGKNNMIQMSQQSVCTLVGSRHQGFDRVGRVRDARRCVQGCVLRARTLRRHPQAEASDDIRDDVTCYACDLTLTVNSNSE